jgi:hypothetical protein
MPLIEWDPNKPVVKWRGAALALLFIVFVALLAWVVVTAVGLYEGADELKTGVPTAARIADAQTPPSSLAESAPPSPNVAAAWPVKASRVEEMARLLGSPWTGEPFDRSDSPDSFSGGASAAVMFKGGTILIFTIADGRVWRLRLLSGMANRCGPPIDQAAAISALASLGIDAAKFRVVNMANACIRALTFTAI